MPRPALRSTFARATVPVAGGIAFFAVLGVALWGVAALVSRNGGATENLARTTFRPLPAERYATLVEQDGPIIFQALLGTSGDRTVVLDHDGADPLNGWSLHLAHPADRPITCKVTQVRHTDTFTDCDGRTITVDQLAVPPRGVQPQVTPEGILQLDVVPD